MKISKSRFYTYGRIAYPKGGMLYNGRMWSPPAFLVLEQYTTRRAAQASIQADWNAGLCVAVCKGSEILQHPAMFYWNGKERDPPESTTILSDPIPGPDVRIRDRFTVLGDTGTVTQVTRRRVTIVWSTVGTYSDTSILRSTLARGLELGTWTLARS